VTGTAKRFRRGTHRSLEPEETLERVRPLMGPLEITRLSNVTGLDSLGTPIAIACSVATGAS
jgi:ribosomal protein S12 methylthiotransferase accessory factor YcaO